MDRMKVAARRLEELAVKHAPVEGEGRAITLQDPAGVYYVLGTDSPDTPRAERNHVQLLFFDVPEQAEYFATRIGFSVEKIKELPVHDGKRKAISAMLSPMSIH